MKIRELLEHVPPSWGENTNSTLWDALGYGVQPMEGMKMNPEYLERTQLETEGDIEEFYELSLDPFPNDFQSIWSLIQSAAASGVPKEELVSLTKIKAFSKSKPKAYKTMLIWVYGE